MGRKSQSEMTQDVKRLIDNRVEPDNFPITHNFSWTRDFKHLLSTTNSH